MSLIEINKVIVGCDHAALNLKAHVIQELEILLGKGVVEDVGTHDNSSCDYPEFSLNLSQQVLQNKNNYGILICGSGIGISLAANKVKGIRAMVCHDQYTAEQARKAMNCNVIGLGERVTGFQGSMAMIKAFLNTQYEDKGVGKENLELLKEYENKNLIN